MKWRKKKLKLNKKKIYMKIIMIGLKAVSIWFRIASLSETYFISHSLSEWMDKILQAPSKCTLLFVHFEMWNSVMHVYDLCVFHCKSGQHFNIFCSDVFFLFFVSRLNIKCWALILCFLHNACHIVLIVVLKPLTWDIGFYCTKCITHIILFTSPKRISAFILIFWNVSFVRSYGCSFDGSVAIKYKR